LKTPEYNPIGASNSPIGKLISTVTGALSSRINVTTPLETEITIE